MSNNAAQAYIEEFLWSGWPPERLRQLKAARDMIDLLIEQAVEEARAVDKPTSWKTIGKELGISRQAAWMKYGS